MKTPENTLQDTNENSDEGCKYQGLEVVINGEAGGVTETLETLNSVINHDTPVTTSNLSDLTSAIEGISVDVAGTSISITEIKDIPNFKRNIEIFKEIQYGNFDNTDKLTFITSEIAESLSKHKGDLYLRGLTTLSDPAAESLSKHEGDLYLSGLTTLSDSAAESFSKKNQLHVSNALTERINRFKK